MIKRIIKFVPKSEYRKIYDALFKSHLSYCISSWGAIPHSKLQGVFAIQKRCIRLLFGVNYSFDHAGYYETCARSRTYQEHMSQKNYILEHTKPLFNKHNILSIFNLFTYHTFLDIFKILKTQLPISLHSLFKKSQRDTNFILHLPEVDLDISKRNFVFSASSVWNKLVGFILEKNVLTCLNGKKYVIIVGSTPNSDLCATIPFVKNKLKAYLFNRQASGGVTQWVPDNVV